MYLYTERMELLIVTKEIIFLDNGEPCLKVRGLDLNSGNPQVKYINVNCYWQWNLIGNTIEEQNTISFIERIFRPDPLPQPDDYENGDAKTIEDNNFDLF